jgi:transcriptional regulator with XRE-family HTH domain
MYENAIEKISDEDISYFRERNRNRVYAAVTGVFLRLVEKESLTKREIAFRLGKEPSQITRWLSGPSNWTLDTISDLLLAMGAELEHSAVLMSEKSAPSIRHPLMDGIRQCNVIELNPIGSDLPDRTAGTNAAYFEAKVG